MKHLVASALFLFFLSALILLGGLVNPGKVNHGEIVIMGLVLFLVLLLGTIFTHDWINKTPLRFWTLFLSAVFLSLALITLVIIDVYTSGEYVSYLQGYPIHVGAFFLLSFSASFFLRHEFLKIKFPFLIALVYAIIMVVAVEYMQSIFVYFFFDIVDVFFGVMGALMYYVLAHLVRMVYLIGKHIRKWE